MFGFLRIFRRSLAVLPIGSRHIKKKTWYLEYGKGICGGKTVISIAKKIYLVEMRPKNEG